MTPERQLGEFLAEYSPDVQRVAKAALKKLRALVPGAVELVYDNYNALAISFGPTERSSDAVLSIALYPRWVSLFFVTGASLPDPAHLLKGSGSRMRHIVLESGDDLEQPAIVELIRTAVERARAPFGPTRKLIIRSVSAKKRPRVSAGTRTKP